MFPAVTFAVKIDGQIRSKQKDLRKIQGELEKKADERSVAARKEKELAAEVEKISRELKASRAALKESQSQVRQTENKRKSVEERLWASRLEIGQWADILSRELRTFYMRRLALGAAAQVETAYRRAALKEKTQSLSFAQQHHAQVEGLREELVGLEIELQKLRLNREREEKRAETAGKQMQSLYKTVAGRRAILEQEIRELQSSAEEMEKLLQTLLRRQQEELAKAAAQKPPAKKGAFAAVARKPGKLPWPVDGTVIERYGRSKHPELDTYVFSNGIKLRPTASAAIRTVEKGEVLYAGEFMSYGLMALVQHPDRLFSIYGHLGQLNVARGQKVSVGESIGVPGQDDQGRPVVYFELRVGGVAVDPLLWLK